MAEGARGCPCRDGERAGGKGLPNSPVLCQEQSCGPSGGAWSGRGGAAAVKEFGPSWGPGPGCSFSAWLRGGVARDQGLDAVLSGETGEAQRWEPRPETQARGAGHLGFDRAGRVSGEAAAALNRDRRLSGWRSRLWMGGPEDGLGARRASPGGCAARPPVRGAGSPRRAGATGRWGPGRPCWASAPHPGPAGGRGEGGPALPRLQAWRGPLASRPHGGSATPTAAPEPPRLRGSGGAGSGAGGEGGPGGRD